MGTSYNRRFKRQEEQLLNLDTGEVQRFAKTISTLPVKGAGVGKFSMYFHRSAIKIAMAQPSAVACWILFALMSELVQGNEVTINAKELSKVLNLSRSYIYKGIAELIELNIIRVSEFHSLRCYQLNAAFVHHGNLSAETAELQRIHGPVKDRTKEKKP